MPLGEAMKITLVVAAVPWPPELPARLSEFCPTLSRIGAPIRYLRRPVFKMRCKTQVRNTALLPRKSASRIHREDASNALANSTPAHRTPLTLSVALPA